MPRRASCHHPQSAAVACAARSCSACAPRTVPPPPCRAGPLPALHTPTAPLPPPHPHPTPQWDAVSRDLAALSGGGARPPLSCLQRHQQLVAAAARETRQFEVQEGIARMSVLVAKHGGSWKASAAGEGTVTSSRLGLGRRPGRSNGLRLCRRVSGPASARAQLGRKRACAACCHLAGARTAYPMWAANTLRPHPKRERASSACILLDALPKAGCPHPLACRAAAHCRGVWRRVGARPADAHLAAACPARRAGAQGQVEPGGGRPAAQGGGARGVGARLGGRRLRKQLRCHDACSCCQLQPIASRHVGLIHALPAGIQACWRRSAHSATPCTPLALAHRPWRCTAASGAWWQSWCPGARMCSAESGT